MAAEGESSRFTMIHLFVVIGCVLFLIGLLLPSRRGHGESGGRIKCSSNLRQIGLAMKMYADGETRTHAYPRTRYDPATADRPMAYTKPNATQPFAEDGPLPNDVTAALFLVLRTQEITTDVFLCPMASNVDRLPIPRGKEIKSFSNFPSQKNLSYGMQNPYPNLAAVQAGFVWTDKMNADMAIMADINSGVAELKTVTFEAPGAKQRKVNSPNHQYDGQNVLYADGHVDWSASVWAGAQQDNIYGFGRSKPGQIASLPVGIVGPPADATDSVILPTWDANIRLPTRP